MVIGVVEAMMGCVGDTVSYKGGCQDKALQDPRALWAQQVEIHWFIN